MEKYLYHYTSIEILLLILKNKTLAFNSLQNVDDIEEAKSEDIENIGKMCYVSCWTYDKGESIPMWNMYTNMHGVRIKLKEFPFKKYQYEEGEYQLKKCESYINFKKLYEENKANISYDSPKLYNVEYTNDRDKLYPKIKTIAKNIRIISETELEVNEQQKFDLEKVGRYKRENWSFQNEVRYIINMAPWSIKELEMCKGKEENIRKLTDRIEDTKIKSPYKLFFLELSEEALSKIEILLAPKITPAEEEIVNLIVEKYCPTAKVYKSSLQIR